MMLRKPFEIDAYWIKLNSLLMIVMPTQQGIHIPMKSVFRKFLFINRKLKKLTTLPSVIHKRLFSGFKYERSAYTNKT